MSSIKKFSLTIKEKLFKFIWEILERIPKLKKFTYKLYDRFWYLEKLIGNRNSYVLDNQKNKYNMEIDRLKYCVKDFIDLKRRILKDKDNWDLPNKLMKIEDTKEFLLVQEHFLSKTEWKKTNTYEFFRAFFSKKEFHTFTNETDFLGFLNDLDEIYQDLKESNLNLNNYRIKVGIGRDGKFILLSGIFYLSIMKIINIKIIPIEIIARHQNWLNFKQEIYEYLSLHQDIYQPLLHPDLKTIKTSYTEERFNVIKHHLHVKSGALLDIGSNFGFFCHKFEELGFNCYAVEIRPRNVYFMKKLRDIEGKNFKILNKSIFEIKEKVEYDIVLALNIFHHFLKEKELFQNLIIFLKSIKTKEMFFQPHNPKEKVMRNTYINFLPQQFVEFIIKNSCLNKYEMIVERVEGDNKDRPIFRLFK